MQLIEPELITFQQPRGASRNSWPYYTTQPFFENNSNVPPATKQRHSRGAKRSSAGRPRRERRTPSGGHVQPKCMQVYAR